MSILFGCSGFHGANIPLANCACAKLNDLIKQIWQSLFADGLDTFGDLGDAWVEDSEQAIGVQGGSDVGKVASRVGEV